MKEEVGLLFLLTSFSGIKCLPWIFDRWKDVMMEGPGLLQGPIAIADVKPQIGYWRSLSNK